MANGKLGVSLYLHAALSLSFSCLAPFLQRRWGTGNKKQAEIGFSTRACMFFLDRELQPSSSLSYAEEKKVGVQQEEAEMTSRSLQCFWKLQPTSWFYQR